MYAEMGTDEDASGVCPVSLLFKPSAVQNNDDSTGGLSRPSATIITARGEIENPGLEGLG